MGVLGQDRRALRLRRRLAAVLVSAVVLTLLLLAPRVASAAAPICDPRAAIGFAPPPQLQDPEQSLDLDLDEPCGVFASTDRAVTPDGGGFVWDASAAPSAHLPDAYVFVAPPSLAASLRAVDVGAARPPHARGLERPPRA